MSDSMLNSELMKLNQRQLQDDAYRSEIRAGRREVIENLIKNRESFIAVEVPEKRRLFSRLPLLISFVAILAGLLLYLIF